MKFYIIHYDEAADAIVAVRLVTEKEYREFKHDAVKQTSIQSNWNEVLRDAIEKIGKNQFKIDFL